MEPAMPAGRENYRRAAPFCTSESDGIRNRPGFFSRLACGRRAVKQAREASSKPRLLARLVRASALFSTPVTAFVQEIRPWNARITGKPHGGVFLSSP